LGFGVWCLGLEVRDSGSELGVWILE
jgi:hypothetical protein